MRKWCVFLIKCDDGSFFCGSTQHLKDHLRLHGDGLVYETRKKRPFYLVTARHGFNKKDAFRVVKRINTLQPLEKVPFLENF